MASFEEFSELIRRVTGSRRPISRDTDIARDLGVAGMDGDRLAAALFETYGFKFTDEEFDRHFGPEQAMTPWHLVLWLLGRGPRPQPLSVGELFDRISNSQGH